VRSQSPNGVAPVAEERYRRNLWESLLQAAGPKGVSSAELRRLRIYGGAQGIWVDKERTARLTEDGKGVTVSVLHTGAAYADDLSEDGVIYHYPDTDRPPGRDLAEIDATKAAGRLGLPVFVVTYPSPDSALRDVSMGWVEDWDDDSKVFLITFGDAQPVRITEQAEEEPFVAVQEMEPGRREVAVRAGGQRFKFRVFRRYGPRCAVCGMDVAKVLDAAHIRPRNQRGSDDPRNGLVLCAVHHRALDAGLFAVEPTTLEICFTRSGPDVEALRIRYPSLGHLRRKPHPEALQWRWQRWGRSQGAARH
jgi:putative restriction endonuclease